MFVCVQMHSFDFVPDELGSDRKEFPHTVYMAAGTQALNSGDNYIMLMKLSNLKELNKSKKAKDDHPDAMDEDASGDSDDDDSNISGIFHSVPVFKFNWQLIFRMRVHACHKTKAPMPLVLH